MKNALFFCALLVAASAEIRVLPVQLDTKNVEDQGPGLDLKLSDENSNPTPFVSCDGTKTCRVVFLLTANADLPTIDGDLDMNNLKRYAKIDLACCVVSTFVAADACPKESASLTSESDWVEVPSSGFPANPLKVPVSVQLPPSDIGAAFSRIEKCFVTVKHRKSIIVAGQPVLIEKGTTDTNPLRVDFFDLNAVANTANGGKLFVDVSSTTFQTVTITIPKTFHDLVAVPPAENTYVITVVSGGKKNVFISDKSSGPDLDTITITKATVDPTCSATKCTLTFYARRVVATTSGKFEVQQATTDLMITHSGKSITVPITNSLLFAAAAATQAPTALAPGAIISVNGETGVASQASLQNRTVVVESVHATNVPDDEYSGVSAGIVYAAVGSAFVFVCVLGLIAAKLGSKAALKGV
jgi:hypothetical protein